MIVTNTHTVPNRDIAETLGVAAGEAVLGVDIDYGAFGSNGPVLMVSVNGTAAKLR